MFLESAKEGDVDAGLNIAELFLGEVPTNNIELILNVAEILMLQSAQLGSGAAKEYLESMWPQLRNVLRDRYIRKGLQD